MSALSEKLRRARTLEVPIGKHVFHVLRPTPFEYQTKLTGPDRAKGFLSLVVGWKNVVESDLVRGGDPHPLEFDAEACAEWLADRPDLYTGIVRAAAEGFVERMKSLEDAGKN